MIMNSDIKNSEVWNINLDVENSSWC